MQQREGCAEQLSSGMRSDKPRQTPGNKRSAAEHTAPCSTARAVTPTPHQRCGETPSTPSPVPVPSGNAFPQSVCAPLSAFNPDTGRSLSLRGPDPSLCPPGMRVAVHAPLEFSRTT
ncbi:hypothetical protein AAFF_G00165350 [Aldrovandia affinis]|uniref:Uncharacterized protein n=1 Tax=Aldrovandia affinis TaxID=143900 RepID=A0AAD7W862_9TELE|nr:hypothetical protein AAFF_G00165350 [Aldrovandia affinis]